MVAGHWQRLGWDDALALVQNVLALCVSACLLALAAIVQYVVHELAE